MGTPPTETANGATRSAASPAAAGTRSPNPTQLVAAASASRTRIGILQFSKPPNDHAQQRRGPSELRTPETLHAPAVCCSVWFGLGSPPVGLLPATLTVHPLQIDARLA